MSENTDLDKAKEGSVISLFFSETSVEKFIVVKPFNILEELTDEDLWIGKKERNCQTPYEWINFVADCLLMKQLIKPVVTH